jgi:hypothetical protein
MNTFIVIFNFRAEFEGMSAEDLLKDHGKITKFMWQHGAKQVTPSSFIIQAPFDSDDLMGELTPFVDRGEDIFIFAVKNPGPFSAVASESLLSQITQIINLREAVDETEAEDESIQNLPDQT